MAIPGINHPNNVLTDNLEATRRFYIDVLGLAEGSRPAFNSKAPGPTQGDCQS
jgi:catechol 2,3-dioxygenase-like lactoylglutathione lyase family enzyme